MERGKERGGSNVEIAIQRMIGVVVSCFSVQGKWVFSREGGVSKGGKGRKGEKNLRCGYCLVHKPV